MLIMLLQLCTNNFKYELYYLNFVLIIIVVSIDLLKQFLNSKWYWVNSIETLMNTRNKYENRKEIIIIMIINNKQ